MTTLKTSTCPTCGGNHPPGAHHRPQTVAQRPPQLPEPEVRSREQDADDDPAADDGEEQPSVGVRSKNGNEDDEDAEEGEANNRVGVRSGVAPNNKVGVRPRVAPNSQPATALPPPPPEGAPAGTWDFYLRTLPSGAEGRRRGARSQIQEALADLDRGQRVEEGRKYAHSAEERQFLEYTGYLPTLDEETDARIMAQEQTRRAAIAAARRARAAYQKTRSEYRETFFEYTGKQSTGSKARDAEIWKVETDRRRDVYAAEFRDYTGNDPTFDPVEDSTIWQAETDRRKTTPIITEMDTPADVAESLVTAASPASTTPALVDTGPTPTGEGPETFTYTVTGTAETAGADGSEGKGSLVQQGLASSPYSEIELYRMEFKDYTGEESTGDYDQDTLIWQKATDRQVAEEVKGLPQDLQEDYSERVLNGASTTDAYSAVVLTFNTRLGEQKAASDRELTEAVNGLPQDLQDDYFQRVKDGADPFDAYRTVAGIANTRVGEQKATNDRELTEAVNGLPQYLQDDYSQRVMDGADPYDAYRTAAGIASTRELTEAVNGLPQDLQDDYFQRVMDGADPYEAYRTAAGIASTRLGEQKTASDRELTEAVNGLPQDLQDDYFQRVMDGADPFDAYSTVAGIANTRLGEQKTASNQELTEAVNGLPQDLQDDYFQRVMDGADPYDAYRTVARIANTRAKEADIYIAMGSGGDFSTQDRAPLSASMDFDAVPLPERTLDEDLAFHNNKTLQEWQAAKSDEAVATGYADDLNTGSNTAAESRLQTIDGENFYQVIDSMPEVVYAGGERKTWAELFPHTEDSRTGARLRRDMEGTGLTDHDAATVREWLNSGYLSLSDNKAPDVAIIEKPLPDVSAYYQTPSTSDSEAHKRFNEAHAKFDQQIADAKAAGKVVIVQDQFPLGDLRRGAFLAELIPGVGLIKAYIGARGPDSDGGTAITERERNAIAFELALTAADIAPIPATKAFSVGGRIARSTKAVLPTGPDAIARRYDALVSRDMNQGGYLGRLTVGELPSDARVANTFYKDVDRFSKSGLVSTEDAVALAAQKRSFTPEQLAEIRDPGGLSKTTSGDFARDVLNRQASGQEGLSLQMYGATDNPAAMVWVQQPGAGGSTAVPFSEASLQFEKWRKLAPATLEETSRFNNPGQANRLLEPPPTATTIATGDLRVLDMPTFRAEGQDVGGRFIGTPEAPVSPRRGFADTFEVRRGDDPRFTSIQGQQTTVRESGLVVPAGAVSEPVSTGLETDPVSTATQPVSTPGTGTETQTTGRVVIVPESKALPEIGIKHFTGEQVSPLVNPGALPSRDIRTIQELTVGTRPALDLRTIQQPKESTFAKPEDLTGIRTQPHPVVGLDLTQQPGFTARDKTDPGPGLKEATGPKDDTGEDLNTKGEIEEQPEISLRPFTGLEPLQETAPQYPERPPRFPYQRATGRDERDPTGRGAIPRPRLPQFQSLQRPAAPVAQGPYPQEAEFFSLELNRVNLLTGETEEIPVNELHEETLRVTKRGRTPTEGRTADTGGVAVKSRGGKVQVEDEVRPRPGTMARQRPPSPGFPGGRRGGRRRDDDSEYANGASEVKLTLT